MKKFIPLGLILFLTCSMQSKAYMTYPGTDEPVWGEEGRHLYYDEYNLNSYKEYGVKSEEDQISYVLDKLAVEYLILDETIALSDECIFINGNCADTTWCQLYPEFTLDTNRCFDNTDKDYNSESSKYVREVFNNPLNAKVDYMNGCISLYNKDNNYLYNLWWYSLGPNKSKYYYIIDDIRYLTELANLYIANYNIANKTSINHISYLKSAYPNNNSIKEDKLKERWEEIVYRYEYEYKWQDIRSKNG